MSLVQDVLQRWLPAGTVRAMREQTNRWQLRCLSCNRTVSLWESGGIRYGKAGVGCRSATLIRCRECWGLRLASVERVPSPTATEAGTGS